MSPSGQWKVWIHQTSDNELAVFMYKGKPSKRLRRLMCAYVSGRGLKLLTTGKASAERVSRE